MPVRPDAREASVAESIHVLGAELDVGQMLALRVDPTARISIV